MKRKRKRWSESLYGILWASNARDLGSIPGLGRSPGGGNGNPHSSILAWKIPWTEEPGRLQSMGLQKVRHDQVTFTLQAVQKQISGQISLLGVVGPLVN